MTVILAFLVVLMALFAGWLISQSVNVRPWVAQSAQGERPHHWPQGLTAARMGLGVFLAVATSLFALCVSAYVGRMAHGSDWAMAPLPGMLWVNSGVLVLASVGLQGAWNAARAHRHGAVLWRLAAGGLLSVGFIAGQYLVWQQLAAAGYYADTNPAHAFFYLLTGLHALHLLGGLAAWAGPLARLLRGATTAEVEGAVELCALYWHYLLLVWLALFALLLAS